MSQGQKMEIQNIQIEQNSESDIDIEEQENKSVFSEDFQSDHEQDLQVEQNIEIIEQEGQQKVKNPVSAYMVFVSKWKQQNPGEKLKIAAMGDAWRGLSETQRSIYEQEYKGKRKRYDEYVAHKMSIDPNFKARNDKGAKDFLFPLHRVKGIMKKDPQYRAGSQAVATMSRATQYFGEYLLKEIRKQKQGKKRVDANDLFQAITTNQGNLWFLECLIDEHNNSTGHQETKVPSVNRRVIENDDEKEKEKQKEKEKRSKSREKETQKMKSNRKLPAKKQLPKGQMKITDIFK